MTTPNHPITCPKCGAQLQPVALDPYTAPWLCANDARGYWATELTTEARALFRPHHDDWGLSTVRVSMAASVELEIADAQARGTSLRPDQFTLTPTSVLSSLASRPGVDPTLVASSHAEVANRGVK